MARLLRPFAALAVLFGVGAFTVARATPPPQSGPCCGCIELSGAAQSALPAFFCGFFPGAAIEAAEERCDGFNQTTSDPGLLCLNASARDCRSALAQENVACPGETGAPTASSGLLTALVVLLACLGWQRSRRGGALRRDG